MAGGMTSRRGCAARAATRAAHPGPPTSTCPSGWGRPAAGHPVLGGHRPGPHPRGDPGLAADPRRHLACPGQRLAPPACDQSPNPDRTGRCAAAALPRIVNTASSTSWPGLQYAPGLAAALLDPATARYRHSAGVAAAASFLAPAVDPRDAGLLVAAGWLHDIGYSPAIADTGFHPLDGARHLRRLGAPEQLCRLVAHHTGAVVEARLRGLDQVLLDEFPPPASPPLLDALTYADLTTSPTGAPITVTDRLAEILLRYPPGHVVHRAISLAAPDLLATARRVDRPDRPTSAARVY